MRTLALLVLLAVVGLIVIPGDDLSLSLSDPDVAESEWIATISTGEAVDIADHLDPEGWTVVEFGALW